MVPGGHEGWDPGHAPARAVVASCQFVWIYILVGSELPILDGFLVLDMSRTLHPDEVQKSSSTLSAQQLIIFTTRDHVKAAGLH
jgi:hypothetical protein